MYLTYFHVSFIDLKLSFSLFKESQHLSNEKEQTFKPFNLPSIFQKLVQSVPTVKPLFQITDRGNKILRDLAVRF